MFSLGRDHPGIGHVVLNVLRAFNLIGLAAIMLASWAMPVLSGIFNNFFFFDTFTHFFIFLIAAALFYSELPMPWFKERFRRSWPVLGPDHSLAWLGFGMIFIGFQVLGDLVKPAYTINTIGLAWWRAILASGILAITFGVFNLLGSLLFRFSTVDEKGRRVKVTSRQIRTHGKLAEQHALNKDYDAATAAALSDAYSSPPHRDNWSAHAWSGHNYNKEEEAASMEPEPSAMRRITRVFQAKNLNFRRMSRLQGKVISHPIQISHPMPPRVDDDDRLDVDLERGGSAHSHDRASPIMPEVQRPPTALHPAFTGGSRYSEANMSRF